MFAIESDLDLMTGEITNIREYHTRPEPVDTARLAEEALMPDEEARDKEGRKE
jgi:hypothetical protein